MSKKITGGICAIVAILACAAFVVIGTLRGSYENLWLILFGAGIFIAVFSIAAKMTRKEDGEEGEKKR